MVSEVSTGIAPLLVTVGWGQYQRTFNSLTREWSQDSQAAQYITVYITGEWIAQCHTGAWIPNVYHRWVDSPVFITGEWLAQCYHRWVDSPVFTTGEWIAQCYHRWVDSPVFITGEWIAQCSWAKRWVKPVGLSRRSLSRWTKSVRGDSPLLITSEWSQYLYQAIAHPSSQVSEAWTQRTVR